MMKNLQDLFVVLIRNKTQKISSVTNHVLAVNKALDLRSMQLFWIA